MLCLTRNIGQRIMIGEDIVITIIDVTGHQVRLGIEAPRNIPVHREEIYKELESSGAKHINI